LFFSSKEEAKMPRNTREGLVLGILTLLVAGCASSQGQVYQARSYIDDRERIDQKMEGNAGYIMGKPKPEDRSNLKKSRQVFVVEFNKEDPSQAEEAVVPAPKRERMASTMPEMEPPSRPAPAARRSEPIALPNFDEERAPVSRASVSESTTTEEYIVQKGDTLQKISKKFYNTYRRWVEIYEANKDVMSDPNKLKAGMRLRIPGVSAGGSGAAEPNLK